MFCSRSVANSPLIIYGDGRQTRDFVHVSDVMEAVVAAIRCDTMAGRVFNIGSGRASMIGDVAEIIRSACGSHSEIHRAPPRPGDIRHSCADVSAAEEALGFRPKVAIKAGLADAVAWFTAEAALAGPSHPLAGKEGRRPSERQSAGPGAGPISSRHA